MHASSHATAPAEVQHPRQISHYRIEKYLGSGAFSSVYLAHDEQMQRLVAIKVTHPELTAQPDQLVACLTKSRHAAAISHPNIVPVYEVGSTDAYPCFVVCRFIDGTSLAERLRDSRPSFTKSAEIVATVAEALHEAHVHMVVHGDIHPGNILLDRSGNMFVSDFSPTLVCGQRLAGTPAYMSPEQIRGEEHRIGAYSDIFSLGVVFYEMLTGRRPVEATSHSELTEPTPPRQIDPSIPPGLERVCLKMIRRRIGQRYSSAQELADDLRSMPADAGLAAPVSSVAHGLHVSRSTILFTDFKGFTDRVRILEQAAGPRAAAELKRTVAGYVEEALQQIATCPTATHRLLDTAGDGFFFQFDSAEGAYRFTAALNTITALHNREVTDEISQHWFRTGAATGTVAWSDDKPVGNVVNVSSRHQAACMGGDFIIDEATYTDLPEDVRGLFGPAETIYDKHAAGHVVRRTAFGRPLPALAARPQATTAQVVPPEVSDGPATVEPKGLRSFTANDSDFFLELLPGPRNRQGIPDIIRIMKERIESRTPDDTFSVGCIYGPSGCGKSSLVKAGLLPRLAPTIVLIFIEASGDDTESLLLERLQARFPQIPEGCSLTSALTMLRRGSLVPEGGKVLIVIDQFEQWLQVNETACDSELTTALRQCDGIHVQCFVMVRDEFWAAVNRFMRDMLDIRLIERVNSTMLDLFDIEHASKVLTLFGRAYGRLPDDPIPVTKEQRHFIRDAVAGLAVDGKVVPVRLSLFAEMLKNKDWTAASLKKIGGAAGVGVAFLEETFGQANASARYRHHQQAARNVLKSLLPNDDTMIRRRRTLRELIAASGYEKRPEDFADLRDMLDGELRLITAIIADGFKEPAGDMPADADAHISYQLAHDFLVPSLREWLIRGQKETRRGRAELLLADRANVWSVRPEDRQLPSLRQCLQIRWWTRPRDWTMPQQKMMRRAAVYYGLCLAAVVCLALGLNYGRLELDGRNKAIALVDRLLDAKIVEVPGVIDKMGPYRRWVDPLPGEAATAANSAGDPLQQLAIRMALLPIDGSEIEPLYEHLLAAEPQHVGVIIAALEPHKMRFLDRLRQQAHDTDPQHRPRRLRAAAALASYVPNDAMWQTVAAPIAGLLVEENPLVLHEWMNLFSPVRRQLSEPLKSIYRNDPLQPQRIRATGLLSGYYADDPAELTDLVLTGNESSFETCFVVLFPRLVPYANIVKPLLREEIDRVAPADASEQFEEDFVRRKAIAVVALLRLNDSERLWPLLRHTSDPRCRSYIIEYLAVLGADAAVLADRVEWEPDVDVRRALLLSLGSFAEANISQGVRTAILPKLMALYKDDPDPGIHAASEWILRMWHRDDWLKEVKETWQRGSHERFDAVVAPVAHGAVGTLPQWYVNEAGQTMVVIPGPIEFLMGAPLDDELSNFTDPVHPKRIGRTYAIASKQVTIEQYQDFDPTYEVPARFNRLPNLPAVRINWYMAAAYCNHLSRLGGIPTDQWCYGSVSDDGGIAMCAKKNLLTLTGYRLPTEAEIEYSTRAGAMTERHYGASNDLLPKYAWFAVNSQGMTWPVGTLKPNDLGLFDVMGNVLEWTQDVYHIDSGVRSKSTMLRDDIEDEPETTTEEAMNSVFRSQRGGSFLHSRWDYKSAARTAYSRMVDVTDYFGFRLARTLAVAGSTTEQAPAKP